MVNRIEVGFKEGKKDPIAEGILNLSKSAGIPLEGVERIRAYTIDSDMAPNEIQGLCRDLFTDPIVEVSSVDSPLAQGRSFDYLVEIGYKPGVMDTAGETALEAIGDITGNSRGKNGMVYTSTQYLLRGAISQENVERLVSEYLANDNIQRWHIVPYSDVADGKYSYDPPRVKISRTPSIGTVNLNLDEAGLRRLSSEMSLALNAEEMNLIQQYVQREDVQRVRKMMGLPGELTDVEIEVLAQTWSEHCKHKIFNATVEYRESDVTEVINGLFDNYIKAPTKELEAKLPWVKATLGDNAGTVGFNEKYLLALKAETHNSPSNVEPFGGSETGLLGVQRDPGGTGKGARIIFGAYGFCTGNPQYDGNLKPRLHPGRIFEGVRSGVESAGNKMGVPTPYGNTFFHDGFMGKPAIYVFAGGLIPAEINGEPGYVNSVLPGDLIVMTGGRVGIDGIHGATQSSMEAGDNITAGHVQIGSPYTQKKMMDFLNEARDAGLYRCITDNGAGGLSSSVGEMAQKSGGFEMHLDAVPLKYYGLDPWQILVSESQERMTLAVDPSRYGELQRLAKKHGVEVSNIGTFNNSGKFAVFYNGTPAVYLDMNFVHNGVPKMHLKATWIPPEQRGLSEPVMDLPEDYTAALYAILARPNIASKEYIARQFDHEVQGSSVIKPLVGEKSDVFSDAAMIRPDLESDEGITISAGLDPSYSDIDTYHMAAIAIDEAIRKSIAVGGKPDQVPLNDNFCWPSPLPSADNPDAEYKMAQLVRANKALRDYSLAFQTPFVSGKDSMSMDGTIVDNEGKKHRISAPPTLQISAVAKVDDIKRAVTMDVKKPGDLVYVIGNTRDELGGSEYYQMTGHKGTNVPKVDAKEFLNIYKSVADAISKGLVASVHGVYRGGLGVALAQSSFAGGYGMDIDLAHVPTYGVERDDKILFSQSAGRFVVTVPADNGVEFENSMRGIPYSQAGHVTGAPYLKIRGIDGREIVNADINELKSSWKAPFRGY